MKLNHWIGLLCLALVSVVLWRFRQVVLLVFTAVVLATSIEALVRWIGRRLHLRRRLAVFAAVNVLLLSCAAFIALVMPPFVSPVRAINSASSRWTRAYSRSGRRITECPRALVAGTRFSITTAIFRNSSTSWTGSRTICWKFICLFLELSSYSVAVVIGYCSHNDVFGRSSSLSAVDVTAISCKLSLAIELNSIGLRKGFTQLAARHLL